MHETHDNHVMNYDKLQDTHVKGDDEDGFWFGDPCYVVPDELWIPFCDAWQAYEKEHDANPDNTPLPHSYIANVHDEETGVGFYSWNTAYGDGTYKLFVNDKEVASLGVDAGTLSAIPMKLIKHWKQQGRIGEYSDLGHVVSTEHLNGEIVCEGGDFFWDGVRLPTGYSADHEDEEECEEEGWFS
jgi:hypothetical protein